MINYIVVLVTWCHHLTLRWDLVQGISSVPATDPAHSHPHIAVTAMTYGQHLGTVRIAAVPWACPGSTIQAVIMWLMCRIRSAQTWGCVTERLADVSAGRGSMAVPAR
jgi:hypothetical protein